jgi:hypothetical protein
MGIVDSYFWKYEDDMFIYLFKPSRSDPLQHYHDDFQPFPKSCDTHSFEHLELFYEYFQQLLCLDFTEHSHKGMIPLGQQELIVNISNLLFPHLAISLKIRLKIMVCHKNFQPHIDGQQALSWEIFFFLRSKSMSHFLSIFSLGNHHIFLRFLMLPSQTSGSDEIQGSHSLNHLPKCFIVFHRITIRESVSYKK